MLTFQKSAAKIRNVGQCFIVANATHGPHSPMNVSKRCLGHKQDLTDCAENLDKENPSTCSLTLALTRADFSEISSQKSHDQAAFQVMNATHGPHSPMNVPKRCLDTQTRPDRLHGEPRQGEPFHALIPLAPITRVDFSEISSQKLQDQAAFHHCECHAWTPLANECS